MSCLGLAPPVRCIFGSQNPRLFPPRSDPSGNAYYMHSVTGESQWEAPLWIDQLDSESGTTYYLNTVTNETSWEQPSAFIPIVRN